MVAADFCVSCEGRAFASRVVDVAFAVTESASVASGLGFTLLGLMSEHVGGAVGLAAALVVVFDASAGLAASSATRASVSTRAEMAAMASAFGTNSAGCENATGSASFGAMIMRMPIRTLSNSLSAKP